MGIFSDRCQALVDPQTGRALTGEPLEKARQERDAPRCGHPVRKAAKFCSRCGGAAPRGWAKCPHCGKWVGNESNYCWNCKAALHPESRDLINAGQWQRAPDTFAERIEVADVRQLLAKGLLIEPGTAAILLDGGKFRDVLGTGRHSLDSLANRINHWGDPPPRTVILVEAGDVALPVSLEDLHSAEGHQLSLYAEICLQFDERAAEAFVANLMRDRARLTHADLAGLFSGPMRHGVENLCKTSTIEDLIRSVDGRAHLEESLRQACDTAAGRWGIRIVHVPAMQLSGPEYDRLLERNAEIDHSRREAEWAEEMRKLATTETMARFKTDHDLEEYAAQLANERGLNVEERTHEIALLTQAHRQQIECGDLEHRFAQKRLEIATRLETATLEGDHRRGEAVKDATSESEIARIRLEQEDEAVRKALIWRAEKERLKQENMREMASIMEGKDLATLIALVPDEGQREHLLQLNQQRLQTGRSAEEILAIAAASDPAAAQALGELARMRRAELEGGAERDRQRSKEEAERLERVLNASLEAMARAAASKGDANIKIER